ncbi:MAG TPA: Ig-like domain-containing protein, partial [Solirubrobacterales bacterium]|nr:Ig-like domain-containing protein [Solirubrobacterales bacterium]
GNQAVATRGFEVDTALPPAPVLSATAPGSPANHNSPLVLGEAQAGTTLRLYVGGCSGGPIDTFGAAQLEAGVEVSVEDDSVTVFRATATTEAGNTSGCSEPLAYVEDSADPETTIDVGPPALGNSATAAFEFSGADSGGSGVASFECRVDSESVDAWETCSSGIEFTGLAEGQHKFEIRAIDEAGNADQSPAVHQWQIDLTAPQPAIDSLSKALLKAGESSEVEWHANENGAFELRVGGADCETGAVVESGAYDTQTAPRLSNVSAAQLVEGANTLRLCLTDAAGNRGAATAAIAKDSVAPQTAITLKPAAKTNSTAASFEFTGTDPGGSGPASFECRLDGGAWMACASSQAYADLGEGQHSFAVRALDNAGNRDQSPAEFEWQVDLTPPAVQVESGPDNLTSNPSPSFGFSAEAGAALACSIDTGAPSFGPCSKATSHTPATPLSDGAHAFRVRATDAAGNEAVAARDFEVDATAPPSPQLDSTSPASPANENEPLLLGSALADATVDLFTGGSCSGSPIATFSDAELEAGVAVPVPDNSTTVFRATASDTERTSGCSEPLIYVEDSSAPQTTIASAPPATTLSTSASFFPASSEPDSNLECSLDGSPFEACGSPTSYAELALGPHTFSVQATDPAGNLDLTPAELTWTVDPPPTATSACDDGGVEATTATGVRAAVQTGEDVCVTAAVGDVNLSDLGARPVVISTAPEGSIDDIDLASTTDLTISRARFRTTTLRNSHRTRLLENTIGGTPAERVLDQLIFMPTDNDDVAIEGNDLGWTIADNGGNSGYGCRCYGDLDRLRFAGNKLHDLAADGFQGVGGVDVTIDRNEIGPVGRNPGSNEHTDNIQITGNEANLRITNNWIHHQGYYEGEVTANAGSTYIHGGSTGSLRFENNLIETAQGRTEICGLGTGGSERSNLTVRRNTWVDGGIAFNGFPGFE